MANQSEEQNQEQQQRPIVMVHRLPTFSFSFANRLKTHYHLFDPLDSPDLIDLHRDSVRAIFCVGPSPVTSELIARYPCLEIIVGSSAGVDHIDLRECRRRGIAVTNAGNAFSEAAAEYAVGLLIDALRRVSAGDRFVRAGLWPKAGEYPLGFKLGGKRVGIVGLGSIGSEVANRLAAFGCSIAYNSRKKKPSVPYPYYAKVCDLAVNSDVLVVCCALADETHHIINKDVMTALGKEGVIINVGRGKLVDEKELVQFLVRGEIGGAGLDVFENEPYVPKELFTMDNVVLSPHRAVLTQESFEAIQEVVVANLEAFFANKPLVSPVQNE
ncbi:2-Hacid_dh domain-containing protein/2-Hacid_dh_C domain-containing protein [Cephalotus follicularis]|uniref:glyoxylate reductase (NADP(+)) n=1 Tax=Cephalotus follicularis TaxID=3775 RepID=A0A1Q3CHM9_CEPFO|nr:2-Hacid_dh domain-containing protein/2-Hacid_dh_C domain-containing protein [Cephalotus follicularis]